MGEKYPLLLPREIIPALRKMGFEEVSQRGSHLKLQNQTVPKRTVIIPCTKSLHAERSEVSWHKPVSNSTLFSNCCRIFLRASVRNKF
ncbi:MAG: type II toxin-antitoxin system HicA family toxin [Planctomycetaceae bacterium]|jgi:predicted RNA binding protein YcfA (HicA-like mRNA interferase family)|nr:type II toxin-antitoxin system HicA family toxin [Planctomycetaceae bacterium]